MIAQSSIQNRQVTTPDAFIRENGLFKMREQGTCSLESSIFLKYGLYHATTGASITHARKLFGESGKRFFWPNGKPDHFDYVASDRNIREAVQAAGGAVWLVTGVKEVIAFHTAGLPAIKSADGEGSHLDTLIQTLHALGATHVITVPDCDKAGYRAARAIRDTLAGSGIHFEARELPYKFGRGGDAADLWNDCDHSATAFRRRLELLPAADLPAPPAPKPTPARSAPSRAFSSTVDWDRERDIWFHDVLNPALPAPAKGKHSHCPNPHHEDKNPSFRVSHDKGYPVAICTCGVHKLDDVAGWVGVPAFMEWWTEERKPHLPKPTPKPANRVEINEEPPEHAVNIPAHVATADRIDADVSGCWEKLPGDLIGESGVYCIKSQKGTGKTTQNRQIVEREKTRLDGRSMLITPIKSLTRNGCETYGLEDYESVPPDMWGVVSHFGITARSVSKFFKMKKEDRPRPRVLVLDEITAILNQTRSRKIFDGQSGVEFLVVLTWFIKHAELVLITDADLDQTTIDLVREIRADVTVIENTYQPDNGTLIMASSRLALETDLVASVENQQGPIFGGSGSKAEVERLAKMLEERYPEKRVLAIHQENSSNPQQRQFIENPDTIDQWDVVIASPSIRTGLSIDKPVWRAYLIVEGGNSSSASEALQHIARARTVTDRTMAYVRRVEARGKRLETADAIYDRYRSMRRLSGLLLDFDADGTRDFTGVHRRFMRLHSELEARRNGSLNDIHSHFVFLAQRTYTLQYPQIEECETVGEQVKAADELVKLEKEEMRLDPATGEIDEDEHGRRSNLGIRTDADNAALYRYRAKDFYKQDLDKALYDFDQKGGRRKLSLFIDAFHSTLEDTRKSDIEELLDGTPDMNLSHRHARQLLARKVIGEVFGDEIDPETVVYQQDVIDAMSRVMDRYKRMLWLYFGWRDSHSENPWDAFLRVMRACGLRMVDTRRKGDDKQYKIDPESWAFMQEIAAIRLAALAEEQTRQERVSWGLQNSAIDNSAESCEPVADAPPRHPVLDFFDAILGPRRGLSPC